MYMQSTNIIVGSLNPTKINAIKAIFEGKHVTGLSVPSDVSAQPFSDEETRNGAINRAKNCLLESDANMAIGLEGGVMLIGDSLFLCNWGALYTRSGDLFTASGARIELPEEIKLGLDQGKELGDLMDDYANRQDVRNHEGAIGIFTNGLLSRQAMFEHVAVLLRGQLDFAQK